MISSELKTTKISELPTVATLDDSDVLIVNHNGVTSKMLYSVFKKLVNDEIKNTINNIMLAGFNIVGLESED